MDASSTDSLESRAAAADGMSLRRWLAGYAAWLLALSLPAAALLARLGERWTEPFTRPREFFFGPAHAPLKLLVFAFYVSVSCQTFPLPTGWIVAALATREVALSQSLWLTTLLVATVGAAGSTMANLHDYHVYTWMLRRRSIARVRDTRLHRRAARWFGRRPFALIVLFNVLPIPVDVVRMLSATARYPRRPFAAANFLGRWIRYAAIAAVAFLMGPRGWWVVGALLAAAVALGLGKLLGKAMADRK